MLTLYTTRPIPFPAFHADSTARRGDLNMELRKRLLEKLREHQSSFPSYNYQFQRNDQQMMRQTSMNNSSSSESSLPAATIAAPAVNMCKETVDKILDSARDQFRALAAGSVEAGSSKSMREYVSRWNSSLWPVLDAAFLLNSNFPASALHDRDYSIRRDVQHALSMANETSPLRRHVPQPWSNDGAGLLYQHYLGVAEQMRQLASAIAAGCPIDQVTYFLRQFRSAATVFTSQIVPQVLNSEAIKVRILEQHRHLSAAEAHQSTAHAASPNGEAQAGSKSAPSKISDHLLEFSFLLDWCFALVGTVISNTTELLNQTFLHAELSHHFALIHNDLQGIAPTAATILCSFLLWVSNQPPMIMVTKTEFTCRCALLNNYFIHDDQLRMQIVYESTAHEIQQKFRLKNASLFSCNGEMNFPSAGILVMKKIEPFSSSPNTSTLSLHRRLSACAKRRRRSHQPSSTPSSAVPSPPASAPLEGAEDDSSVFIKGTIKNDDYNSLNECFLQRPYSQERLDLGWHFDPSSGMVIAEADQACCTDRNLANDCVSPASSSAQSTASDRQRDIYYLHCWSKIAIFGAWYELHTLSLPFVIPTRKNQDLQLHRMLKSYSATIFWLHVAGKPDGFLIEWNDQMNWTQFSNSLNAYFMKEARVTRGLSDFDFMLLKEKAKCSDCGVDCNDACQGDNLSYQNIICPHLFYQCGEKPVLKYSLWRALLDLIQLFQSDRTKVRELWERGILGGLWSMDSVSKILVRHARPVLMSRISLLAGGSIVLSFLPTDAPVAGEGASVIHTEPLDQQQLTRRNLVDCVADIVESEGIECVLDCNFQPLPSNAVLPSEMANGFKPVIAVGANSDQLGCPNSHRQYLFHALKLSMVPSKSADSRKRVQPGAAKRVKAESALLASTNGVQVGLDVELRRLMQQYGYSSNDMLKACQKLLPVAKNGSTVLS